MWSDESVYRGQSAWLLRAAFMRREKDQPVHFAGLVVAAVSATHTRYWRRIGYWNSDSGILRTSDPPTEYKQMALRKAQLGTVIELSPSVYLL